MSPGLTPSTATSSARWSMRWTRPGGSRTSRPVAARRFKTAAARRPAALAKSPGLMAALLYAELGYALRASAGPARTRAWPAAPAGRPQAGQPRAIGQQLGDAAG